MKFSITTILILFTFNFSAQSISDSLQEALETISSRSSIPGFSLSIVNRDSIVFQRGFGYADKDLKKPYDQHTIHSVASVSKTVIAIALLKLVEEGRVDLNVNINRYLPFEILNPYYPEDSITLIQLAQHTSSILETDHMDDHSYYLQQKSLRNKHWPRNYSRLFRRYSKNTDQSLEVYLFQYLSKDGRYYKRKNFSKYPPGSRYSYTNAGACLLAYTIEQVVGKSFAEYVKEVIFEPLEMTRSTWKYPVDSNNSRGYFYNTSVVPQYNLNTYPSGDLRTSASDMGNFLLEIRNGSKGKGRLLKKSTYEMLYMPANEGPRSIFWKLSKEANISHGGAEIGTTSQIIYNPKLDIAFFLCINMSIYDKVELEGDYVQLLLKISEFAKKFE